MAKDKQSKDNKKQGKNRTPRLVFDERGAFKKVAGLSKDPAERALQLQQLLLQLGEDQQLKTVNLSGVNADLEAAGKDLSAAQQRERFLEERVQELSSKNQKLSRSFSLEKACNTTLREGRNLSERRIKFLENERRITKWLSRTYPGFKYAHTGDGVAIFEFAGLYVELMQTREHCRFIVFSSTEMSIKLEAQTIEVGTELTPDVFALLQTYVRAVTPEGHAEFSKDYELRKLYSPGSKANSRGDRLQNRCVQNAARLRSVGSPTRPDLPRREPGKHFEEVILTGSASPVTALRPTQEQDSTTQERREPTAMTSRLLGSIEEMRQQARQSHNDQPDDTSSTEETKPSAQPDFTELIIKGAVSLFNMLTNELTDAFGIPKETDDSTSASAPGSPHE